MSIAADLFHSTDASRETLHRRITPTDEQFEDQKTRWNDLAAFLKTRLKNDTGLPTSTWLQGSYKFDTQIRPWETGAEFDIDLGFYFEWNGEHDDGDHGPEKLKTLVQAALKDYQADAENDATGLSEPKERCCRISFDPDFHIDVPCYHLDRARDARGLATETKGWEESDPKAIYKWFRDRYDDASKRAQLRRLVRYLKMWAALGLNSAERPSSILLTVLAAEAIEELDLSGMRDDDVLEHAATVIHDRLDRDVRVENPIDEDEDLNRLDVAGSVALVKAFAALRDTAKRAREAGSKADAAEVWADAFGQFFPLPEDNGEEIAKADGGARTALAVYRFDPQIRVRAVPQENEHRSWSGLNELPAIPKDCDITFRLVNADELPAGASLRWTVRNRGDEAARLNDLGHIAGTGVECARSSAYNGDHAMDLTVRLGSQVIGRRRVWVKVRGNAIAPRNKPQRRHF